MESSLLIHSNPETHLHPSPDFSEKSNYDPRSEVENIDHKLNALIPLLVRRPRSTPIDGKTVMGCPCGSTFSMVTRQHHCRSCGKVFCWACTDKRIVIPEILVEYQLKVGWWREEEACRVCHKCYDRIIEYEQCSQLLEQLRSRPQTLDKVYELSRASDICLRAVAYYLSEMSRIQYLFASEELNTYQMGFLRVNKSILSGHSRWLMHLLKIENDFSEKSDLECGRLDLPKHDSLTLCSKGCLPYLHLGNAVTIMIFSKLYGESTNVALKMLKATKAEDLIPYIPVLALTFHPELYVMLTDKAKDHPRLATIFYWSLNILGSSVRNREHAISYREALLMDLKDLHLVHFRRFIGSLEKGLIMVKSMISMFKISDPLNPSFHITSVETLKTGESSSRPIFVGYRSSDNLGLKQIMYKKEDTRKDACIVKIIKVLAEKLGCISNPFPLVTYMVIPISDKSGFVEIVGDSKTLFSISQEGSSINNFFQQHNADRTIGEVQEIYTLSLAFWTIVTYIFGVGDRHFDNIMLSTNGTLFHIDYGFIFGEDPKPYSPKIRLNSYMIEGIGGDQKYPAFKELCYKIFGVIRQHMDQIYIFLLELAFADPKIEDMDITEPFVRNHLSRVFFIGETEDEVRSKLGVLIDASRDSFGAYLGEYIHGAAKTSSKIFGHLTGSPPL